jgi:hypothetical protein
VWPENIASEEMPSMRKTKWVAISMLFTASILSGCGAKGTTQTVHTNNIDISISLSPTPIAMMQDETFTVLFSKNGKAVDVKNVFIEMVMPSMAMNDKVEPSEITPGKFQGSYRFSMNGNWNEEIHYTEGSQPEITSLSWDVKN